MSIEDNDYDDDDDEKPLLKALRSFAEGALKKKCCIELYYCNRVNTKN